MVSAMDGGNYGIDERIHVEMEDNCFGYASNVNEDMKYYTSNVSKETKFR